MQARERAWRIGQDKQVTIYRLLTTGTVEEKIYHRQIFKQYLTNKILKNPKQRRFFKTNDLYELFRLGNDEKKTESSDIFAGTNSEVAKPEAKKKKKKSKNKREDEPFKLPQDKIDELRERAKKLSQMMSSKFNSNESSSSSNDTSNPDKPCCSSSSSVSPPKDENAKAPLVEGKRIKYLDKCDLYKEQVLDDEESDEISKKQDEYVLKKLFKNASMHSALQHDAIEGATSSDYIIVENEAERVANEAIKALQRSRERCLSAATGVPNWTGHNGYSKKITAVVKTSRPAFGKPKEPAPAEEETIQPSEFFSSIDRLTTSRPASKPSTSTGSPSNQPKNTANGAATSVGAKSSSASSLLDAIRQRNRIIDFTKRSNASSRNGNGDTDYQQPEAGSSLEPIDAEQQYEELVEDLRMFIAFKSRVNGEATTAEVLNHFKDKIPNEQTAVFKALLWKLCTFIRRDGEGYWILKRDFR